MNKKLKIGLALVLGLAILIYTTLYFIQESLIFNPSTLSKDFKFNFKQDFEEVYLKAQDGTSLHSVLFKSKAKKGVILFLHGNGKTIEHWGLGADFYIEQGYDIFYLDYRGYGKSEGKITSEKQFVADAQLAYDYLKDKYDEKDIILSGTSMGTGLATQLASKNKAKLLLLNAPYSSLEAIILESSFLVPSFIIKYKLKTDEAIKKVNCPIVIFHGNNDETIPHQHSLRLQKANPKLTLHILDGFGHNNIPESKKFEKEMKKLLK